MGADESVMVHDTQTPVVRTEADLMLAVLNPAPSFCIERSDIAGAARTLAELDL